MAINWKNVFTKPVATLKGSIKNPGGLLGKSKKEAEEEAKKKAAEAAAKKAKEEAAKKKAAEDAKKKSAALSVVKANSNSLGGTYNPQQKAAPAPKIQPAAPVQYIQPAAKAQQIQPAATTKYIQPAATVKQASNGVFTGNVISAPMNQPVFSSGDSPQGIKVENPQLQTQQSYFDMSGGGGGGGGVDTSGGGVTETAPEIAPVYQPDWQVAPWDNRQYDLNDPVQRQNYYDSKISYLAGERDKYISESEAALNRSLTETEKSRDQNLASIDQDIADTEREAGSYAREYFKRIQSLAEGKRSGDIRRQQYFSSLSPNAYQSSLNTSNEYANQKYGEAIGEEAKVANEYVGSAYLQNPNDPNLLNANTMYGRQRGQLMGEKSEVGRKFNVFSDDLARQRQQVAQKAQNYFNTQRADTQNALSPISFQQTGNPYSFVRENYNRIQAPTVDTSNQRRFTEFQTPQQYESAQPGTNFMPIKSNVFSQQEPIETYLGKTQVTPEEDKSLRKYLFGV